jgi:hypothetical protein
VDDWIAHHRSQREEESAEAKWKKSGEDSHALLILQPLIHKDSDRLINV